MSIYLTKSFTLSNPILLLLPNNTNSSSGNECRISGNLPRIYGLMIFLPQRNQKAIRALQGLPDSQAPASATSAPTEAMTSKAQSPGAVQPGEEKAEHGAGQCLSIFIRWEANRWGQAPLSGAQRQDTNWNTGSSSWTWGRTSLQWGCLSPGTGCTERCWSLLLWRYPNPRGWFPVRPAVGNLVSKGAGLNQPAGFIALFTF